MKELILEYLNNTFYCSVVDNATYKVNGDTKIGFAQIERNIIKVFRLNVDLAHLLIFNWLLSSGIKFIMDNWSKEYTTNNTGVYVYETTTTGDKVFEYEFVNE